MSIYKYNSEIEFDLPYGYKHISELNDEGELCDSIVCGAHTDDDGEIQYDFTLNFHTTKIEDELPGFSGSVKEALHNINDISGVKYIVTNSKQPFRFSSLGMQKEVLIFTALITLLEICVPVGSDTLLLMQTSNVDMGSSDEEAISDKIEQMLKVLQGLSVNGKKLDFSGLNADELTKVLMPDFDDAPCKDVTAQLYGGSGRNRGQSGNQIHKITRKAERVILVNGWSMEVPKGFSYCTDNDKFLVHIQESADCDFSERFGSAKSFLLEDSMRNVGIYGDDLTTRASRKKIKDDIKYYEDARSQMAREMAADAGLLAAMEAVGINPEQRTVKKAKHTEEIAAYYAYSPEQENVFKGNVYIFVNHMNVDFRGNFYYEGDSAAGERWLKRMLKSIEKEPAVDRAWTVIDDKLRLEAFEKSVSFAEGIEIPVPKGFHYSMDKEVIGETRRLVIVPEDYALSENPMESLMGLSVSEMQVNFNYRRKLLPQLIEQFPRKTSDFFTDGLFSYTLLCHEEGAIVYQYYYSADSTEGLNKAHILLFADGKIYFIHLIVNQEGFSGDDVQLHLDFKKLLRNWIGSIRVKSWSEDTRESAEKVIGDDFTEADPEEQQYLHYRRLKELVENPLPGTISVVNAQGTEYEMISLKEMMEELDYDWDDEDPDKENNEEMKSLYARILEKDTQDYSLAEKADEMRSLFHVNKEFFDPRHDRECEIGDGLMHRAYMMSGLRSFAWTLADYCQQHKCTPKEVTAETVGKIVEFIAEKNWLNYDAETYCTGLCGGSDLHVYYLPEGVSEDDKRKLLPSEEDIMHEQQMKKKYPSYCSILPEIHSLAALREDLEYIYPAVKLLWEKLSENRNYDKALLGDEADVVYAWCVLALAAEEPFFTEDGPMGCGFVQNHDKRTAKRKEKAEEAERIRQIENAAQEWEKQYGAYVESNPKIEFKGKLFVFSGLAWHDEEKEHPTVQKVIEKGGEYRTSVSGKTDYLVVSPGSAGAKKVNTALEQKEKGKNVKIILLEDLENILAGKLATKDKKQEKQEDNYQVESKVKEVSEIREERPAERNDGFEIEGDVLISYHGEDAEIVIPEGIKEIGSKAFYKNGKLKTVEIPDSVEKIGESAFYACTKLVLEELPKNLKEVGESAFYRCSKSFTKLTLPLGVQSIGEEAFSKCIKMNALNIPAGLEELSKNAFAFNTKLQTVHCSEGLKKIGEQAFEFCRNLSSLNLPIGLEEIGTRAFWGCESLQEVKLPEGLKKIGESAFDLCELREIVMPESIEQIVGLPFSLRSLKKLTFPESVRAQLEAIPSLKHFISVSENDGFDIEGGVLKGYEGTKTFLSVPDGICEIEDRAFICSEITSITIPEGVERIGDSAFYLCSSLRVVSLPSSLKSVGEDVFYACDSLKTINGSDSNPVIRRIRREYLPETYTSASTARTTNGTASISTNRAASSYNNMNSNSGTSSMQTNNSEGCYIATAVYGSYDAPQVMTLRKFRDETLRTTAPGRWFIRTYYRLSPPVAEKLKNAKHINAFVRKLLDKWVERQNRREK